MSQPEFRYPIYIRASREQVWNGFLQPEFTRQYWFHENVSDWNTGSTWEHRRIDGSGKADIAGRVLEADPHRRIVLTWSRPGDVDDPARTSRLSVDLADIDWPGGPWTAMTLEHTDFGDDVEMREGVSGGWPMVLSGLKTLLEVGLGDEPGTSG